MGQVPLSNIINISISRQTQGVTQAGFGVPLILTDETPVDSWGAELVRSYSNVNDVLEDWTSSDDAYLAAVAVFAQSPKVTTLKIGLETTRVAQTTTLVFSADLISLNVVSSFTIVAGGKSEVVTATTFGVDNATTLAAITAKIQALTGVNASDNGTNTITIVSAVPGVSFTVSAITVTLGASQATVALTNTVANVGPAESLAAINEQNVDWYGVIWIERNQYLLYEMMAYIETQRKLLGSCSSNTGIYNSAGTTDIAYIASVANFERTYLIWNADPTDFADAAWMGKLFPFDPGSATWKFKTLTGIIADSLTSAQREAIKDKNCNIYITSGGVDYTEEGVVCSGEYIDTIHGVDWLQARLEERIFSRLVTLPKIPFTDAGISIIVNEIAAVLENAIRVGLLSPDALDPTSSDLRRKTQPYIITAPLATAISSSDRADRHLTGVTFEARVAGAIHKVTINGVVTV